jgi:hypothetical protein
MPTALNYNSSSFVGRFLLLTFKAIAIVIIRASPAINNINGIMVMDVIDFIVQLSLRFVHYLLYRQIARPARSLCRASAFRDGSGHFCQGG